MWKRHTSKRPTRRQRAAAARAREENQYRPHCENLEDRTVPSILFSSTGSRTIMDSGGPILSHMQVDMIFWGNYWPSIPGRIFQRNVNTIAMDILNSTYFDGLGQYRSIGRGSWLRTDTITTSSPGATFQTVSNGDLATMVANNINNGTLPAPNGQILYFVVPQPGSTPSDCGCVGRHLAGIASNNRVFPYGLTTNPTNISFDTLSIIMSHEMAEAATNPEWNITFDGGHTYQAAFHVPGNNGDEIGDGEPNTNNYVYRVNGALVQAYLSMRDRAYIVTNGGTYNFLVSSARVLSFQEFPFGNNSIDIYRIGNAVAAELNSSTAQFEPGSITGITVNALSGDRINIDQTGSDAPVTVNLGSGPEEVGIGNNNLGAIQGSITVRGGTGSAGLAFYDTSAPTNLNLTYTVTSSSVARPGMAAVTFTGLGNGSELYLFGSNGQDLYNVSSTPAGSTTIITGGSGGFNTFDVIGNAGPLTIGGNNNAGAVYVGNSGRLTNILAPVSLTGFRAHGADLAVLNEADPGNRDVTLSGTQLSFGGPTLSFAAGILNSFQLAGGTGTSTYTVNQTPDTPAGTELDTRGSGDVVHVLGNSSPLTVSGRASNQVDIGANGQLTNILRDVIVSNSAGTTDLVSDDSADPNSTTVNITSNTVSYGNPNAVFRYSNLGSLILYVGSGRNTFTVASTAPGTTTTIDNYGGAGANTFFLYATAAGSTTQPYGSSGNEFVLEGNDGTMNAIQGAVDLGGSGANNYAVLNDGSNTVDETFTFTANTLNRTGLARINYQNLAELILYPGSGNNTIVWQSTAVFPYLNLAAPVGGNDTLVGPDGATNLWQLVDGINDELFVNGNVGVAFQRISNLVGGSGDNTFQFSDGYQLPGSIDGGVGGSNTLDYSAYSTGVDVNFQTGTATGVAGTIADIQNVLGGQGANILVGDGNENLTGGPGQNLLIGGGGTSQLTGGGAGDILIGGTTAYDTDDASLQAILSYWTTSGDDYPTRVANLRAGNGVPQMEGGITVFDQDALDQNGAANTITGNGNEAQGIFNLFYVTEAGTVTDQQPDEMVVDIDNPAGAPRVGNHGDPGSPSRESLSPAAAADLYFLQHRDEMNEMDLFVEPAHGGQTSASLRVHPAVRATGASLEWTASTLDLFAPWQPER